MPWLAYGDDKVLRGLLRARNWFHRRTNFSWLVNHWRGITIEVCPQGPLSRDFNKKPIIPILFSHGLTGGRTFYTAHAQEMASHGYLVMLIDHHDGTSSYTELPDRTPVLFDNKAPWFCPYDFNAKAKIRHSEFTAFIQEVTEN